MINLENTFGFHHFVAKEINSNSPDVDRDESFEDINFEGEDDYDLDEGAINPDVPRDVQKESTLVSEIEDAYNYDCTRPRCPSFASQLHNERIGESEIQHYFITDEMISNAAKYAAQIACINLSYSTYRPSSSADPSAHHCCSVCQRSLLLAVSQFFYNNNMDDIHELPSGMPINPSTPKFAATLQVQQGMEHSLTKILQSLRTVLHIRPTELIHALHYFDVLLKRHWMCSTFILFRQSLKTIFAVCCLIAHKMNSDNPFRNTAWSELFGMPILTINEFERSILTLLEYETRLDEHRYHSLESIVGVGEDYFITLSNNSSSSSMDMDMDREGVEENGKKSGEHEYEYEKRTTAKEKKTEKETEKDTEPERMVVAEKMGEKMTTRKTEKARVAVLESVNHCYRENINSFNN